MEQLPFPVDTKTAGKLAEGHIRNEQARVDRGRIGDFFGSSNSVPANIAAIIAIIGSIVLVGAVVFWSGGTDFTHKEGITALSSLVTLALGYLFGRVSK